MVAKKILLLGKPKSYEISKRVNKEEVDDLKPVMVDLHDTMMNF